jgi:pimeloyl-ACP methyl ester carboxylesterase
MDALRLLSLDDGRRVAWEDVGPRDGAPVLFFHGTPGSRLQRRVFMSERQLCDAGLRMITIDRPGCGHSDPLPCRLIEDVPVDVAAVLERLRLDRVALLAFSGGTPYALAAASAVPARCLCIVSGDAPPCRLRGVPRGVAAQAARRPRLAAWTLRLLALGARLTPGMTTDLGTRMLSPADQAAVEPRELRQHFIDMLQDALRQGPEGVLQDLQLAECEWDLLPVDQHLPVHLWHGEADTDTPVSIAHYLASHLPGATLHTLSNEGHVSAFVRHAPEILAQLAAAS